MCMYLNRKSIFNIQKLSYEQQVQIVQEGTIYNHHNNLDCPQEKYLFR